MFIKSPKKSAGFSLVELMVGMLIGLISLIVIVKMANTFDANKRKTSGNADAQTNALLALHMIRNETQLGGYGLPYLNSSNQILKCTNLINPAPANVDDFFPVRITDGGTAAGASDSITVHYATGGTAGASSVRVTATSGNTFSVDFANACTVGDVALVTKDTSCGYANVSAVATGKVTIAGGSSVTSAIGGAVGGSLSCIGQMRNMVFTTDGANMLLNNAPVMPDIVNIQAQYGVSTTATSNQVTEWVDAVGPWMNPSPADRNRIKAIRVAVVARSNFSDTTAVTNSCTSPKGTANNGPCAWDDTDVSASPKIDLSNLTNWSNYRYRSFDIIVPLRNIIWVSGNL